MASTASIATTLTPTRDTLSSSQLLSSSVSSLSSSRHGSSQISKIYRQSSTLFLTRRLPESLSTILPVIAPPPSDDTNANPEPAPISTASRTTRIKVWSLYLTILNAVVELDPDEGKQAFGSQEWRALVTKVREGQVWAEVVNNGYGGVEGNVDSDVVINLATLLLAHAPTQKVNQARLEAYLASSHTPNLDLVSRIQDKPSRRTLSPSKYNGHGTDTPRDLNARVKILELYTLHVLLRNNEWDYAREFISMSDVLDEERREAFLQALQSLRDEQNEAEMREHEERRYQEEQLRRDKEEAQRRRMENEERERKRQAEERQKAEEKKAASSETDYGVENTHPTSSANSHHRARSSRGSAKGSRSSQVASPTARSSIPGTKKGVQPTLIARAGKILANLRALLENMATGFSTRPLVLMQTLAFVIGLLVVLSRRDVKDVVRRGWEKVRKTAGMGVKVSYI